MPPPSPVILAYIDPEVQPWAIVFLYIGPGAGLGAIGPLLSLVGAAALMVIGFVWYPIKRLMRRRRAARAASESPGVDKRQSPKQSP